MTNDHEGTISVGTSGSTVPLRILAFVGFDRCLLSKFDSGSRPARTRAS